MKLGNPMAVLIGVASCAGIVLVALPSRGFERPPGPDLAAPAPEVRHDPADSGVDGLAAEQRQRREVLAFGRDPFLGAAPLASEAPVDPAPVTAPALPRSRLTGISILEGARWAIIDREVVREGQRLSSGFTLESIERGSVTLRRDQEEQILVLGEEQ